MNDSFPPVPAPAQMPSGYTPEIQAAIDNEHLKIMKWVYYISGGMTAFVSCFFIIHLTMFLVLGLNPHAFPAPKNDAAQPPPADFFLIMAGVIGTFIVLGWLFGALQIYAGRCLHHRRHPIFIQVIAGIECIFIPWGTALGVFTFMVMNRASVRAQFS